MFRKALVALLWVAASIAPATAGWETQTVGANGYDLVAYQADNQAVRGETMFMSYVNDTVYLFASQDHKEAFDKDPARYLPAYGGYCAFGMANGYKVPVDPNAFTVVDGKLYLNFNEEVMDRWRQDVPALISRADENWLRIKAEQPTQPQ